jgi:hypothetical protein
MLSHVSLILAHSDSECLRSRDRCAALDRHLRQAVQALPQPEGQDQRWDLFLGSLSRMFIKRHLHFGSFHFVNESSGANPKDFWIYNYNTGVVVG